MPPAVEGLAQAALATAKGDSNRQEATSLDGFAGLLDTPGALVFGWAVQDSNLASRRGTSARYWTGDSSSKFTKQSRAGGTEAASAEQHLAVPDEAEHRSAVTRLGS